MSRVVERRGTWGGFDVGPGDGVGLGGRRGSVGPAVFLLVLGLRLVVPKAVQAQPTQPSGSVWVGRRVVQKLNDFSLRIENRIIDRKRAIHFYRVEQVNGPWLWLHAEGNGLSGWALADQVVPVDQGIEFFSSQIQANPRDVFAYVMRATLWQDKKEIEKALGDYSEALRLDPTQGWIFNNRGIEWAQKKDYDRALADLNQAVRLEPRSANVYNNRGTVWRTKKVYDEAIADFSAAIRLDPDYASAYYNRGLTWADKGEFDRAIADFNEAIRLDPQDPLAYYNRGLAWLAKQEYDPAIADFDRATTLMPRLRGAYRNRGLARAAKKEYDRAIADFDVVLKLNPNDARAYYHRGLARAEQKDFGRAIADYDQAIRLNPRFDDAYLSRAWLLATCPDSKYRDPQKAVESATKACELTGWHEAHDLGGLAAVYAQTGNVAAAVKWQSRAIELMTGGQRSELNAVQQVIRH